jgi:hypothetical protein
LGVQTGKRSFLKALGGFLAGFTLQGKLRAQDEKLASTYVRKYRQNSIPPKPVTKTSHYATGVFCVSGCYAITGSWNPSPCSGLYVPSLLEE